MKNKVKLFSILSILFLCLFCLSGCQVDNKDKIEFDYNALNQATFEYDAETNKTNVLFTTTITNNSPLILNNFSLTTKLYNNYSFVHSETYTFGLKLKNGDSHTGYFNFYVDGQVDSMECIAFDVNFASFWENYKIWVIVFIILTVIAFIIYLFIMIADDLELEDTFEGIIDFFEYNDWSGPVSISIAIACAIFCIITSKWILILMILASLIAFAILILIAHLIRYIIDELSMLGYSGSTNYTKDIDLDSSNEDDDFNNQVEDICNHINNPEKLMQFTLQQLKDYCKSNNISGYSALSKSELIDLITSHTTKQENLQTHTQQQATQKDINAIEELDNLIGLENVKKQLKRIRAILLKNKDSNEKLNLHMCFYGNPGTGKTVVARLMANIFYETGVLPTNKLIETDRSGLCGQYIGQTAPLTHKKVKEAMGGVLFIDEAYTLCSDSSNDFGNEAIAALLKDMEDYKGKFCVILAGYKTEMEKMIALNPGFDSRINRKIDFPDYSINEQMQIFDSMLSKRKYEITSDAKNRLAEVFEKLSKSKNFANARTIRNALDSLIEIQAVRTIEDSDPENDNERILSIEDIEQYFNEI